MSVSLLVGRTNVILGTLPRGGVSKDVEAPVTILEVEAGSRHAGDLDLGGAALSKHECGVCIGHLHGLGNELVLRGRALHEVVGALKDSVRNLTTRIPVSKTPNDLRPWT